MNPTVQTVISILGLFGGLSGVLTFIIQWRNSNSDRDKSAAQQWKDLYEAMSKRLTAQEDLNARLQSEVQDLRKSVINMTSELANYKRYDTYITEIEAYTDEVLNAIHAVVSSDAYATLASRRPVKRIRQ